MLQFTEKEIKDYNLEDIIPTDEEVSIIIKKMIEKEIIKAGSISTFAGGQGSGCPCNLSTGNPIEEPPDGCITE